MTSRQAADRDGVALRHLARLADELRHLGLGAETGRDRRPFPGLVVTAPAASAVILAGSAHFWRHGPEGDLKLIGPLDDPAATARTVRKHLTDRRRRSEGGPSAARRITPVPLVDQQPRPPHRP